MGRRLAAAVLLLACTAVSVQAETGFSGLDFSAITVEQASAAPDLAAEQQSVERMLEFVSEATLKGVRSLFIAAHPEAPQETRALLRPQLTAFEQRFNERTGLFEADITVELLITVGELQISRTIPSLGYAERVDGAAYRAAEGYREQLGYVLAEVIPPEYKLQIDSLFNGYITSELPADASVMPGDLFYVLQDGRYELGMLTAAEVIEYGEGDRKAVELLLNYAEVPLHVGMELHREPAGSGIPVTLRVDQSLRSSEILLTAQWGGRPAGIALTGGFSAGYSWNSVSAGGTAFREQEGTWAGALLGALLRLEPGSRYRGGLQIPWRADLYSSVEAGYSFGEGPFAGMRTGVSVGRYLSSRLELALTGGYNYRRDLTSPGALRRSAFFLGGAVTFRFL